MATKCNTNQYNAGRKLTASLDVQFHNSTSSLLPIRKWEGMNVGFGKV